MASTIYYGKSATEGNEQIKRVRLVNSTITENSLQEGDILVVYFTEGLNTDNPRLVLYIGDINAEISATSDQGKSIYRTGGEAAQEGDWSAGETVTFIYTSNEGIASTNDNTYYWVITSHNVRASSDSYGGVLIDADDSSATSIGKTKELINTVVSSNLLEYTPNFAVGTGTTIGNLYLSSSNADGSSGYETMAEISMPSFPNIPTALSNFANSNELSLDGATKLGYSINGNFKTIINLKAPVSSEDNVRITSPVGIYLTAQSSENQTGTVAIGKNISSNSYGLAIGKTLAVGSPTFTVDWDGRIKCGDYSGNFKSIFNIFYPVGSYYETSDANFNPNTNWGGTWELEAQGKVHIGAGADYTIGNTGGTSARSYTPAGTVGGHKLTASELPSHSHIAMNRHSGSVDDYLGGSENTYGLKAGSSTKADTFYRTSVSLYDKDGDLIDNGKTHTHGFTGTATSINIMQPYVVVNRWHRKA